MGELPLGGVDHHEADVGVVYHTLRPQRRVILDAVLHLRLPPQSGRVHEDERVPVVVQLGVHRISCGPGDLAHDRTLFAEESVHDARLPHVRFPDDRDAESLRVAVLFRLGREHLDDPIEKIARALSGDSAHRKRFTETEPPELVNPSHLWEGVLLVHHHEHRLLLFAEDLRHLLVDRVEPLLAVHHLEEDIGLVDRDHRLFPDLAIERPVGFLDDPTRVDEKELPTRPLGPREVPVAGDTGLIVDNREALTQHPIEEGRLPDVRPSYDGHHRQAHAASPAISRRIAVISKPGRTIAGAS